MPWDDMWLIGVSGYELRGERATVRDTPGILDSQNVKGRHVLENCLHHTTQH